MAAITHSPANTTVAAIVKLNNAREYSSPMCGYIIHASEAPPATIISANNHNQPRMLGVR